MKSGWAVWAIVATALAGGWAVTRVYLYSAEAGDVFPEYSSLRADPRGARALHDSLAALPETRVRRWYKPLADLDSPRAAVLFLNQNPWRMRWANPALRKEWEEAAGKGMRLVFALSPEPRRAPEKRKDAKPKDGTSKQDDPEFEFDLEKQWKLTLEQGDKGEPAVLKPSDPSWKTSEDGLTAERAFGKGSIALVSETFPFSNEALRDSRDTGLILWALEGRDEVVFDEYHLGTQETGSVGVLMRRYHLEGAALGLVALGLLFLWRMSSHFVPPHPARMDEAVSGRDSAAALASLLRRNIPPAQLAATSLDLWRQATPLLPGVSQERRASVERELTAASADLPAQWRRIHEILTRRT